MTTVGLLLAAGSSTRFGPDEDKLQVIVAGAPLVAHAARVLLAVPVERLFVVVPSDRSAVAAKLAGALSPEQQVRLRWVVNTGHHLGLSTSVREGLLAATEDCADWTELLVMPGDQPGVDIATARAVRAAVQAGRRPARATYSDGPGHPVGLPREVWAPLTALLTGDVGARSLLDGLDVQDVPVAGPAPIDIDTPADLSRVRGSLRAVDGEPG
jgi:molybdenum cofactor cytidylyltransferase